MKSTGLFRRSILLTIALSLGGSASAFPCVKKPEPNPETAFVLKQFRNKTLNDVLEMMERLRPAAVTAQEKLVLKDSGWFDLINKDNEISDPALLKELYRKTQKVLEFHHRAGIVEYLLFKHSHPVLMTKAGAYVAISSRALELTNNDDALSGIIAHELSHEYFALQFLEAYNTHDYEKLRIIELMCDAFSTITMLKLGMNPDSYCDALRKIVHNSKASKQLNDGGREMPSLQARLHVISEIEKQFAR